MTDTPDIRFLDRRTPPHLVTLVMLAGLSAAAMNIFLPSLPSMAVHFDADYRVLQLSVTLYLAVNAVLQIVIGPLSDRLGRRPVLIWAFALFILFSLGILVAPTVEIFLALRMGQAVVVAGMVLSRAIVRDTVAEAQAASRIGYVTMGMALVPMVSPMIGGLLDQAFGWRANFIALAVLGAAVLALVWADLGETASKPVTTLRDQMREAPELLTSPRFWGYNLTAAFASGAFFAYLGGAPYVGVEVFGLSPAALGLWFGSPAVGYMVGNAIAGAYSVRIGVNRMIIVGAALVTAGMAAAAALFHMGFETVPVFFGFMVFVGLGNGMVIPNATAGMLSVRPRLAGTASGLGGAMMLGGGAALSALAAALLVPGAGAYPLLYMMLGTSVLSVVSMLVVLRRERRLQRDGRA